MRRIVVFLRDQSMGAIKVLAENRQKKKLREENPPLPKALHSKRTDNYKNEHNFRHSGETRTQKDNTPANILDLTTVYTHIKSSHFNF